MASSNSPIEWTDASWNPVRGCSRVSEGCRHCYAERVAYRFSGTGKPYEGLVRLGKQGPVWTGVVRLIESALAEPLGWRVPKKIFVNSMSDLFHESLPDAAIDQVYAVMLLTPWHTHQVVTKRPERAARYLNDPTLYSRVLEAATKVRAARRWLKHGPCKERLDNIGISNPATHPPRWIWLLTSVENQATADERIPHLLRCPAAVRGASYEPALGPVDFSRWLLRPGDLRVGFACDECRSGSVAVDEDGCCATCGADARSVPGLDWIIAGGESGPGARPPHPKWFQDARDQVKAAAGAAFFFKQWGAWQWGSAAGRTGLIVLSDGSTCATTKTACEEHARRIGGHEAWSRLSPNVMTNVGKKLAGRLLDGVEHSAFPQVGVPRG